MSSPFHFHYHKGAQAVATLLRSESPRRMNYYRLLKLVYMADRLSVAETGRPIVGGKLIAMERGPLHSTFLDLIKGKDSETPWWSTFFHTHKYELEMVGDPGNGELSPREIDLLNRVSAEHEAEDEWAVGELTHDFAEFQKNKPPKGACQTLAPRRSSTACLGFSSWKSATRFY